MQKLSEKQKIKISSATVALIIVSVILLIGDGILGFLLMGFSSNAMKNQIDARMLDISMTAADMLNGDAYEKITVDDQDSPEYLEMYDILKMFQDNIELEFIYCIRKVSDDEFIFTIDPAEEDPSEFGQKVTITESLLEAQNGISSVDKVPYEDAWGRFYSAYSPIFNSNGDVVGIVAVDFSATWYDDQLNGIVRLILTGLVTSILIGAIIIVIFTLKIRKRDNIERISKRADSMITALASDYRSVYFVDLDRDFGICYREHSLIEGGLSEGESFEFMETFRAYAYKYVKEEHRKAFLDFINPDTIRQKLMTEALIAYTYLVNRDGQESYEMLRMAGVRRPEDRDDHIVHAIGVGFTDVDLQTRESIEQRNALREALDIAEDANRAKTVFLSNMSHEIRTPMNAIIGFNKMALMEEGLSDTVKDYLEKIGTSAEHLLAIINDILDMSKIESGSMSVYSTVFSLRKLIDTINTLVVSQCKEKNITFRYNIDDDVSETYLGDETKIRQIITNILSNAVKYTDEGGEISFDIKCTARYKKRATILFAMTDNGIGMDEDYLPKIFDSFSQEDIAHTNKYGSTGLGMAITKTLVDILNGKIEVKSRKGEGTTVNVSITFMEAEEEKIIESNPENYSDQKNTNDKDKEEKNDEGNDEANKTPEPEHLPDLNGRRILFAEDMDINAQILQKILKMKGMEADRAENGQICVDMFSGSDIWYYDAILMDMRMPVMDGLTATENIRNLGREDAKKIPIIALTANAFAEDVQRSMQAGLNAHLSKPLEPEKIYNTLQKLIAIKEEP